jgi:mannosyltransferase
MSSKVRVRPSAGVFVVAVPGLIAFCLALWGAGALSFDRDEAITVSLARRSVPDILRVLPRFDVVHGVYYLTQHFVASVLGTSEIALRMPSIIGTAVAAAGTAALGRRLMSRLGGLLAGSIYGAMPIAGSYAHVARQYAIVPAVAAIVTLLFLRALERASRRAYAAYAAGMALLGFLHLFAVLLIFAHLLALVCSRPTRAQVRAVLVACVAAVIPLVPLVMVASTQQNLIAWAKPPNIGTVIAFVINFAGGRLAAPILILLMVSAWVPWDRYRRRETGDHAAETAAERTKAARPAASVGVRALALPWLLAPPALLMTLSQVDPVYSLRYVLVGLPGAALLATAGAVRVPWRRLGVGALIVAVLLMIPPNMHERRPSSALDQFREAAKIVNKGKRPGDVVVYLPGGRRSVGEAYPRSFAGVRDIALARSATDAADLTGTEVSASTLRHRFETATFQRAWLVAFSRYVVCGRAQNLSPMNQAKMAILGQRFRRMDCWEVHGLTVELYLR